MVAVSRLIVVRAVFRVRTVWLAKTRRIVTTSTALIILALPIADSNAQRNSFDPIRHQRLAHDVDPSHRTNPTTLGEIHTKRRRLLVQHALRRQAFTCSDAEEAFSQVLLLPKRPHREAPIQIVATTRDRHPSVSLKLFDFNGDEIPPRQLETWGHIPRAWRASYAHLLHGEYQAVLLQQDGTRALACQTITVPSPPAAMAHRDPPSSGVWKIRRDWNAKMEDLFSAFVAKLFHVPPGERAGWRPLHEAFRDPARNILHGILGLDEDRDGREHSVVLAADCADAPYQVRAYFAWKMELPFLFNHCSRGTARSGSKCHYSKSNLLSVYDHLAHPVDRFNAFIRKSLGWTVHSGTPLNLPQTEASDLYPVALTEQTLRPGVVFVDSGGHLILVTHWQPQSEKSIGALFGVDAHPDRTVTHKRFARGTFVFNPRVRTDGFKAFRPVTYEHQRVRHLRNAELGQESGFSPFAGDQADIRQADRFYARVQKLLNPKRVNAKQVLRAKIEVLHQSMLERVTAVEIGNEYRRGKKSRRVIAMPRGALIFQTSGPWEIYSTPARDLRCLRAIDDVMGYPQKALIDLELYGTLAEQRKKRLVAELTRYRDRQLNRHKIHYTRSDGSKWSLSLREIVARRKQLEMAYNPNDCPEIRWAAPPDTTEYQTCRRRAPAQQRRIMRQARYWFAARRRPDPPPGR